MLLDCVGSWDGLSLLGGILQYEIGPFSHLNALTKGIERVTDFSLRPFQQLFSLGEKVLKTSIGYFARAGIFSFGEYQRDPLKREIIELYKGGLLGARKRDRFSPERLQSAFALLEEIGALRQFVYSKDGNRIDTMLIRYKDVKEKIEAAGGKIVSCLPVRESETKEGICYGKEERVAPTYYLDLILPQKEGELGAKWEQFATNTLSKFRLEEIFLEKGGGALVKGFVLKRWSTSRPVRPKEGQCFIRCNSPTESYPSGKKDIIRHALGLRGDLFCFDYPGTWESSGTPYEGTYYLAAEAVVDKAISDYGYQIPDLWAMGFCLGGAVAIHLKKKYHEQGINFSVQNTFNSMKKTLAEQIGPAGLLSPYAIDQVKTPTLRTASLALQDGFDSEKKLSALSKRGRYGYGIVVSTEGDDVVGRDSHITLARAAEKCSATFSTFLHTPKEGGDGHGADPLGDRRIWDGVTALIASKDSRYGLRGEYPIWHYRSFF